MKICLEFQGGGIRLNAAHFKQLIISALRNCMGSRQMYEIPSSLQFLMCIQSLLTLKFLVLHTRFIRTEHYFSRAKDFVGAALPVDVLTYEEKTLSAILRVPSSGLVKLWSALTLLGSYQNRKCAFRVIQTSPFLLALSGNSRELILD
ncbi:ribonuclease P protein subunit p14 [Gopherus evgoodei]|uniref:ribonuclease P protein subunit p14 n=1 Tax=Gopherus evgoodei TaxID=1825980 RepID=UPI0011CED8E0|nr:ribonuclease P protein subunit p14 [Gopherus evgoodei]